MYSNGRNSDAKIIYLKLPEIAGDELLINLNSRQTIALITLAKTLNWRNRIIPPIPSDLELQDDLDAFKDDTIKRLMLAIDLCLSVAECITTSDEVKNALIDKFLNDPNIRQAINDAANGGNTNPYTEEKINKDDCNPDNLFGCCVALVQFLNRTTIDFFESIEALTNNQEVASKIIGAIPGVETLPLDEIVAVGDALRSIISEYYSASYDTNLENEMICELFCLARFDCNLTLELAAQYYYDKFVEYFPTPGGTDFFNDLSAVLGILTDLTAGASPAIVYAMFLSQLGLVNLLSSAFGFNARQIYYNTKLGIDSDDWILLCTGCDYPIYGGMGTLPPNDADDDNWSLTPFVIGGTGQTCEYYENNTDYPYSNVNLGSTYGGVTHGSFASSATGQGYTSAVQITFEVPTTVSEFVVNFNQLHANSGAGSYNRQAITMKDESNNVLFTTNRTNTSGNGDYSYNTSVKLSRLVPVDNVKTILIENEIYTRANARAGFSFRGKYVP